MGWPTCAPNPNPLQLPPTQCFAPPPGPHLPPSSIRQENFSVLLQEAVLERMPIKHLIILPQTRSHIQSLPSTFDCSFISQSSQNVKPCGTKKTK